MLYFAYGLNMNHKQMKERCPSARFLKRAYLENFRFVYDGCSRTRGGAVANIIDIESLGDRVWGGLFEINTDNLAALDCCEGYPRVYQRKEFEVKDDNGILYQAIVYCRSGQPRGRPSAEYKGIVVSGAHGCSLPDDWIQYLESFSSS